MLSCLRECALFIPPSGLAHLAAGAGQHDDGCLDIPPPPHSHTYMLDAGLSHLAATAGQHERGGRDGPETVQCESGCGRHHGCSDGTIEAGGSGKVRYGRGGALGVVRFNLLPHARVGLSGGAVQHATAGAGPGGEGLACSALLNLFKNGNKNTGSTIICFSS